MDTDELFQKNEKEACGSVSSNFTCRQKNLFDLLDKAGENFQCTKRQSDLMEVEEGPSNKRKKSETKHFRGKESLFKRPEMPISKCLPMKSAPDYQKNPQRWTKYTLNDVSPADMTEQSNTTAALSFLRELEDRKAQNETDNEKVNLDKSKFTFKKRKEQQHVKSTVIDSEQNEEKLVFKGSKIVMPEYVIGQKNKAPKKEKKSKEGSTNKSEIKLNHLLEEDPDEG